MSDTPIRFIVFDLGGVMIRLAGGWENACRCAGIPYRPFQFTPEQRGEYARLEADFECGRIGTDEFTRRLQRIEGGQYAPAELRAIYLAIIQEELPGIAELVAELKAAGYHTACLSNTCELHWPVLTDPTRYPGIGQLDFQHASHLFGERKPNPGVFQQFEAAVNAAPGEILFFDDRAENVQAAQARGWHAVQITRDRPVVEQMREAIWGVGSGVWGLGSDNPTAKP